MLIPTIKLPYKQDYFCYNTRCKYHIDKLDKLDTSDVLRVFATDRDDSDKITVKEVYRKVVILENGRSVLMCDNCAENTLIGHSYETCDSI